MNKINEYDFDESIGLAEALQNKAEQEARAQGLKKEDVQKSGIKKYNEVRRRHAIEFLQKIDMKLAALDNKSIANLIKALIALGLSFEDEDELDYYINLLTKEALNRLTLYFTERSELSLWKQLTGLAENNMAVDNIDYSVFDVAAFSDMIKSLKKINKHVAKGEKISKRRDNLLSKVDKILLSDLKMKKQIGPTRPLGKRKQQESGNPLEILKNKMISEGVEVGGRDWNSILSQFDIESDKLSFAKNWVLDPHLKNQQDIQKINELRGVKENTHKKKQEQENKLQRQQENKQHQEQQKRQLQEQEKNRREATQKANKELINKEFQNAKNQKKAEKYALEKEQKTGKALDEKDIKKLKLQPTKNKGR